MRDWLASEAGVGDPKAFSQQCLLFLIATIEGNPAGAQLAGKALSVLIDASLIATDE
jgi:hypothetical protein